MKRRSPAASAAGREIGVLEASPNADDSGVAGTGNGQVRDDEHPGSCQVEPGAPDERDMGRGTELAVLREVLLELALVAVVAARVLKPELQVDGRVRDEPGDDDSAEPSPAEAGTDLLDGRQERRLLHGLAIGRIRGRDGRRGERDSQDHLLQHGGSRAMRVGRKSKISKKRRSKYSVF